uniref:Ribonuclease Z n=1 Tax=Polysiphonia scopulorum TaxID=257860 RepID=A0A1Z1MHF6_9FLOR|nr:ribonuclease Z [Polysiphonia scopulorum]ARW65510.1 ribonuclease Z [Polysiphonia scopulorum]
MIIRYLDMNAYLVRNTNISFFIKFSSFKDIWLFNCTEGCQFNFLNNNLKINNLNKIIVPDLHISSISGLLGLLSTLNVLGRIKSLHIYAPADLKYYLDFGKKYSKTNFSYVVYIHVLKTGLIVNQCGFRIYASNYYGLYEFFIIQSESHGTFSLDQAKINYLLPGPLYGRLKKGFAFLTPDGLILKGSDFTSSKALGYQICCLFSSLYRKKNFSILKFSRIIPFT